MPRQPAVDALTVRLTLELWVRSLIEQFKRATDPNYQPPAAPKPEPHQGIERITVSRDRRGRWRAWRVVAVRRDPPDLDKFAAALVAMTMGKMRQEETVWEARPRVPVLNLFERLVERDFPVIVQPQADGRFTAYVPELDGCLATAQSQEAVLEAIRDQIVWFLPTIREFGHYPRTAQLDGVLETDATQHVVRASDLTKLVAPPEPDVPQRRADQDFIDAYVALRTGRHDPT